MGLSVDSCVVHWVAVCGGNDLTCSGQDVVCRCELRGSADLTDRLIN